MMSDGNQCLELPQKITDAAKAAGGSRNCRPFPAREPLRSDHRSATSHGCDLIVMGSHGRRGIAGTAVGSETVRVADPQQACGPRLSGIAPRRYRPGRI